MKQMDLVYVTYNSSRWIDNCFASIMKSDYDLKKVNVFVVDKEQIHISIVGANEITARFDEMPGFD